MQGVNALVLAYTVPDTTVRSPPFSRAYKAEAVVPPGDVTYTHTHHAQYMPSTMQLLHMRHTKSNFQNINDTNPTNTWTNRQYILSITTYNPQELFRWSDKNKHDSVRSCIYIVSEGGNSFSWVLCKNSTSLLDTVQHCIGESKVPHQHEQHHGQRLDQ